MDDPGSPAGRMPPAGLIIALAVLAAVIIAAGFSFYQSQEKHLKDDAASQLTVIASLKADQIAQWRQGRLAEAERLEKSPVFLNDTIEFLDSPVPANRQQVMSHLKNIMESGQYRDVLMVDPAGKIILSLKSGLPSVSPQVRDHIAAAFRAHDAVLSDLYMEEGSSVPAMDAVAPFFTYRNGTTGPAAAVVLVIDPGTYLYPLILSWPAPSDTSETLLVERNGDSALFLNELRHQKNTALNLTIPLSQKDVPAVMAVLGATGTFEGKDYRGADVISVLQPVSGSPWFIVAKVDSAEAFAGWRTISVLILALVFGTLAGAAIVIVLIWQRRQKFYYRNLFEAAAALQESEARFSTVFEKSPVGTCISRIADGTIIDINDAFLQIFGYSRDEAIGRTSIELNAWAFPGDRDRMMTIMREQERAKDLELKIRRKSGEIGDVLISAELIDIGGERFILTLMQDITDRKRAEELLRQKTADLEAAYEEITSAEEELQQNYNALSESQKSLQDAYAKGRELEFIIQNSSAVVFLWKAEEGWPVKYVSGSMGWLGFTPEDFSSGRIVYASIIHPDDLLRIKAEVARFSAEPGCLSFTEEYRVVTASGETRWVEDRTWIRRDGDGRITHYQGFIVDITDRKRVEKALKESEENYRRIVDTSEEGIWQMDENFVTTYVNQKIADLLGYPVEEVMGKNVSSFMVPEDLADNEIRMERRRQGLNERYERRLMRKDGSIIWTLVSVTAIKDADGRFSGSFAMFSDITERRKAEEALKKKHFDLETAYELLTSVEEEIRQNYEELAKSQNALQESEEKYRAVFENTGSATVIVENDTIISLANRQFARLAGYSKDEIEGKKRWTEFVVKDDLERMLAQHRLRRENRQWALTQYEFRFVRRSGEIRTIHLNIDMIPGTKKSVASLLDITDLMQAQQELLQSEDRFRHISGLITDFAYSCRKAYGGVFMIDWITGAVERITGYTADEIKSMGCWRPLVAGDDLPLFDKYIAGLSPGAAEWCELRVKRKDGEIIWLSSFAECVTDPSDPSYYRLYGGCRDITGHKLAEERLKHFNEELESKVAERTDQLKAALEERELLLREIHHRVKNNLQIVASLFNLQARYIKDERILEAVRESQNRVRAMALVHERIYRSEKISTIDLREYLRYLGEQLFRFYGVKASRITFSLTVPDIHLDIDTAIPLGLVMNELLSNALKHAFPDGRKGAISIRCTCDGRILTFFVSDDGIGMPDGFDWKNAPSLGLRLVNSLVEQLKGSITLEPPPGTVFRVTAHIRHPVKPGTPPSQDG